MSSSSLEGLPASKRRKLEPNEEGGSIACAVACPEVSMAKQLLDIEKAMCSKLAALEFGPPVTHIYNPLEYAACTHSDFVQRYGNSNKKILFLGMNPGPFGMAQNGVAFGDTEMVKEWLCISGEVGKPPSEHPNRPIHGLECSRTEVSGSRFWGLFKDLCATPQVFFKNCYVHNYCPFCFMNKTGKNLTPPSLKGEEKIKLQEICDHALLEVVRLLGVEWVVGVGKFGADRAKAVLKANCAAHTGGGTGAKKSKKSPSCCGKKHQTGAESFTLHQAHQEEGRGKKRKHPEAEVSVISIMHPSPINPAANTGPGWVGRVMADFTQLGLLDIIKGTGAES